MTITADPTLFDLEVRPMIRPNDTARVRRSDPLVSHMAADSSAHTLTKLRLAVLALVRQEPLAVGSELNEMYKIRYIRNGWPKAAWDSPRKRAGELAEDGLLLAIGTRGGERQFIISATGLDVIA